MCSLTKWLKITNQYSSVNENEKPSHLLLNGYKLFIKNDNLELFNKKYCESILNGEKLYIVECRKDIFKLFFDLDFLISEEKYENIKNNLNQNDNLFLTIFKVINNVIYTFYEKDYSCIITTADDKIVKKIYNNSENPENIVNKKLIKKGFHLHFPDIVCNKNIALEIRKNCIKNLSEFVNYFENSLSDIIDEHVFTTSGLRLTGSRKGHFISQTKEFIDEGRPYNLYLVLTNNNIDDKLFDYFNNNMSELINKTSIISISNDIINIKNNPNLYCDEENDDTMSNEENIKNDNGHWERLKKDDIRYIEILRFFNIYINNYSNKDIKRIFCSENKAVFILCSLSKYCTNIEKNHNSEHIYFKLTRNGICQKCFCRCDTLDGRKYGYCKDYESKYIPCTPQLKKILNFKDTKIEKNTNFKK